MPSKAQAKATQKYERKTYDKVLLRIRKDAEPTRETITKAGQAAGLSLSAYIMEAVTERLVRDGFLSEHPAGDRPAAERGLLL